MGVFTFAPFVLIKLYGMDMKDIALLFGLSAFLVVLWGGRLIGRVTKSEMLSPLPHGHAEFFLENDL